MKCLILAAGYATRLYPLTENFPKPLLEVKGKTILDWLVDDIDTCGLVDQYIVVSNHKFVHHFEKWTEGKKQNIVVLDDGTSANETRLGAVKDIEFAIDEMKLDDDLLIIAGDNVLDFSLVKFIQYAMEKKYSCIMRYFEPKLERLKKSGVLVVENDGLVIGMQEKPEKPQSTWCCPPFYFIVKKDVPLVEKGIESGCGIDAPGSFIAWLYKKVRVYAMRMPGQRYDIGTLESYEQIRNNYNGIESWSINKRSVCKQIMKRAFITGITGQDGSYLTELLLDKGYEVHGLIRRASTFNTNRIDHLYQDSHIEGVSLFLHYGDLTDASNLSRLFEKIQPDEIYNLGAQSHVRVSFDVPEYSADTDALGVLRILDAVRETCPKAHFYQASTSELYGKVQEVPQTENTPFYPRSPYAVAKQYGFWITKNYRESYGLHASNGILFNHESPRRGEIFVTRKITMAVARIIRDMQDCLYMGNIDALRDWGYAKDYVRMMWMILQQPEADDYVVATGEMHTVREFIEKSFGLVGHPIEWKGKGVNEIGIDTTTGKVVVRIDPRYFRPAEVEQLLGNPAKAKEKLGWEPTVKFEELVKIMVEGDIRLLDNPKYERGF